MTCPATLSEIPHASTGTINEYSEPLFTTGQQISLPSIPLCPGTYSNCILLLSANIIRYWWLNHASVELIISFSSLWSLRAYQREHRCSFSSSFF
jgi:hypothetical protein